MFDSPNIARHLDLMAASQPAHPALKIPRGRTRDGRIDYLTLTFAELHAEVSAWCRRLESRGVVRGDRVLVMVRQGLPLIAAAFALFRLGAVPVIIDPGMGRKNFLAAVAHSRPRVLLGIPAARIASHIFRRAFSSVEIRVPASSRATARLSGKSQISNPKPQIPAATRQVRKKLSPLRKRLAERLVQAQNTAAMLTTFNEVDMSAVIALRAKYQDDFVKKNGVKLGFMSFFTRAVVHALQSVPGLNAQLDGDDVVQNNYYDIGVAVSTDKGLMVPVLRDCDTAGMADIEKSLADLAKKARDGKITLPDLEGGVFTITNGGIFGSMLSTPILNAPQSGILGLHAINERPIAVNGQVVIRPMMYLALSYDHRLVDGREAVTFLIKIKQAIEDPTRLLLNL